MSAGDYAIGVGIALVSTFLSASGLTLQKMQHNKLAKLPDDQRKKIKYFTQRLWLFGILCMIISAVLSFAVFAFLGQSRASAMAAITVLWNLLSSSIFLGERATVVDAAISLVIITGAVIAVVFGAQGASSLPSTNIYTVVQVLSRQIVWIGAIVVIVIYGTAYLSIRRIRKLGKAKSPAQLKAEIYLRLLLSGLHTGITGMLASSFVVSLEGAAKYDLVGATASSWQFWLITIFLPVSLVMQVGFLNSALMLGDALFIVPIYQCFVIVCGVTWGMIFTGDATGSLASLLLFGLGCLISCVGVGLLSQKRRAVAWVDSKFAKWGGCWLRWLPKKKVEPEEKELQPGEEGHEEEEEEGDYEDEEHGEGEALQEGQEGQKKAQQEEDDNGAAPVSRDTSSSREINASITAIGEHVSVGVGVSKERDRDEDGIVSPLASSSSSCSSTGAGAMPIPPGPPSVDVNALSPIGTATAASSAVTTASNVNSGALSVSAAGARNRLPPLSGAGTGAGSVSVNRRESMRRRVSSFSLLARAVFAHGDDDEEEEDENTAARASDGLLQEGGPAQGSIGSASVASGGQAPVFRRASTRKTVVAPASGASASAVSRDNLRREANANSPALSAASAHDAAAIDVMPSLNPSQLSAVVTAAGDGSSSTSNDNKGVIVAPLSPSLSNSSIGTGVGFDARGRTDSAASTASNVSAAMVAARAAGGAGAGAGSPTPGGRQRAGPRGSVVNNAGSRKQLRPRKMTLDNHDAVLAQESSGYMDSSYSLFSGLSLLAMQAFGGGGDEDTSAPPAGTGAAQHRSASDGMAIDVASTSSTSSATTAATAPVGGMRVHRSSSLGASLIGLLTRGRSGSVATATATNAAAATTTTAGSTEVAGPSSSSRPQSPNVQALASPSSPSMVGASSLTSSTSGFALPAAAATATSASGVSAPTSATAPRGRLASDALHPITEDEDEEDHHHNNGVASPSSQASLSSPPNGSAAALTAGGAGEGKASAAEGIADGDDEDDDEDGGDSDSDGSVRSIVVADSSAATGTGTGADAGALSSRNDNSAAAASAAASFASLSGFHSPAEEADAIGEALEREGVNTRVASPTEEARRKSSGRSKK